MTRPEAPEAPAALRIGGWMVFSSLSRLDRDDSSVHLEPKVMDVLLCLARRPGEVLSKEEILDSVWRVEHVADSTLSHAVAELRRALGDDARRPRYIETIPKRGYRLIATVEAASRPEPAPVPDAQRPRRWMRVGAGLVLLSVLVVLAWSLARRDDPGPAGAPRIVVLPFANLGDPAHDHFAAGITDEIISRLATVRGLQVVSRTTAFNYDATGKSARDIGRDLDVDYILEGAVRWSGDTHPSVVHVTPQLIRTRDDSHLWSGRIDRHPERVLDVQGEIAQRVVDHLDLRLARTQMRDLTRPQTSDPAAYQAYLEALERRRSLDRSDVVTAVQMYRRAVELDPAFAQAWAGLAEASGRISHLGYDRAPERCETARLALEKARALAPNAPETLRAAAFFEYYCQGDAIAARSAFERALERWPGDALAMSGMAYACRRMGRWEEAESWFRRAVELDPRNPTVLLNLGAHLCFGHHYGEGLAAVDRAIELAPDLRAAYFARCASLWMGWGDARRAAEMLERVPGPRDGAWYGYAFSNACYAGDSTEALRLAHEAPTSHLSQMQGCLAATVAEAPEATTICSEAALHYRSISDRDPDHQWPRLLLARTSSLAGRHAEAEREAAAALAMRSPETDAVGHAEALLVQAQVLGRAGRTGEAVALVEQLLDEPSTLSPALLGIDPEWAPLRGVPRIEEIIRTGVLPSGEQS